MLCEYCGRYNNNREDCLSCGALLPRATPRTNYYGHITGVHDLKVRVAAGNSTGLKHYLGVSE